jgi:TonB family protein
MQKTIILALLLACGAAQAANPAWITVATVTENKIRSTAAYKTDSCTIQDSADAKNGKIVQCIVRLRYDPGTTQFYLAQVISADCKKGYGLIYYQAVGEDRWFTTAVAAQGGTLDSYLFDVMCTMRASNWPSAAYAKPPASPPQIATRAAITPPIGGADVPLTAAEIQRHCANVQFRDAGPWPYKGPSAEDYYPDASKRAGEEGRVLVRFTLETDGRPITDSIEVQSSSGFPRLDKAATQMVADELFFPGCNGGKPVVTSATLPINFHLTPSRGVP